MEFSKELQCLSWKVFQGVFQGTKVAEALACKEGLALASDMLMTGVRIATDCANMVNSIQGLGKWTVSCKRD